MMKKGDGQFAVQVRCFAMEEDGEFVYLALERCRWSLMDAMADEAFRARMKDEEGRPSQLCMQVRVDRSPAHSRSAHDVCLAHWSILQLYWPEEQREEQTGNAARTPFVDHVQHEI